MKKLILFFYIFTAALTAQWEIQNPEIFKNFVAVHFADEQHGWLGTDDGDLYRTTNGGDSWELSYSDPVINIDLFFFVDADYGWAYTSPAGRITLKTTNGGVSWMPLQIPIERVFFVNHEIGYGRDNLLESPLYKTTDGGNTWIPISDSVGVIDIFFITELTGFFSAREGRLFKTTDGGTSWNELPPLESPSPDCPNNWYILSIHFVNDSVGFYFKNYSEVEDSNFVVICDAPSKLVKTTDGGDTWFDLPILPTRSIQIVDEYNWWSGYPISRTTNGGQTWINAAGDYPGFAVTPSPGIFFVSPEVGYAAGQFGVIFKTTNSGINWKSQNGIITNLDNGTFLDADNGWVVGNRIIGKTTNGGEDWLISLDSLNINYRGISFLSNDIGFVTGWQYFDKKYILKTVDGGNTWKVLCQLQGIQGLGDINFLSDSVGYLSAQPGFLKTTDGGNTWIDLLPGKFVFTSFFINPLKGWVVEGDGQNFTFMYTTDGGINWNPVTDVTPTAVPSAIFFINEDVGWFIDNEDIYKSTDGGVSWFRKLQGYETAYIFQDIHFINENVGWAAGYPEIFAGSLIFKSTDGGENWIRDTINYDFYISKILSSNNDVWLLSFNGVILHQEVPMVSAAVLSSFTASVTAGAIKLQWTTSGETNNKGFEVERSIIIEGSSAAEWNSIAFIPGKGTTSEAQVYSYEDSDIFAGKVKYRLKNVSLDGSFTFSDEIEPSTVTSVEKELPLVYSLEQNYPNPFNPATTIKYSIPENTFTTLKIYDILGNEVALLVNEQKAPGRYQVTFNSENLASGVYYYSIKAGSYNQVRKMIMIK